MKSLLCALAVTLTGFAADSPHVVPADNKIEEQRNKIREATEKFRAQQVELYKKMQAARRDVEQVAQAEPLDEKAVREKAAVIGELEGDLALLRAKHFQELKTVLPHDQAATQSGFPTGTNRAPRSTVRETSRNNVARPVPSTQPTH